ncbi:major sperm protein [Ophiocordyceps camponoti-floridani]|uniref:Major sperm protein n=1 Tax=Ophiocordyceps camponoti-floridani TaxID=2030778 RepID=A0A8H4Q202_9HYPO|nr:major sperm protein [Ophiocordyceps camponoti-floridani]
MSVDIEPQDLNFRRPFTVEVSQILTIKNPTTTPLAFKVKTTAPKQYCVRPNAGRIEPGQRFDVTVLLQAMRTDPPLDAKCRDKFLVQSAPITADKEFASIALVLESTEKGRIQERKIRVNWLPAAGSDHGASVPQTGTVTPNRQSMVNGRNVSDTPTSRTYSSPRGTTDSNPPPSYSAESSFDNVDAKSERPKSAVSQAATTVSESAQSTYEELKAKLAQAEAQIVMLKDNTLRQRGSKAGVSESTTTSGPVAQAVKQADGVPVQVVAILCLLSFLLAYFFF